MKSLKWDLNWGSLILQSDIITTKPQNPVAPDSDELIVSDNKTLNKTSPVQSNQKFQRHPKGSMLNMSSIGIHGNSPII